MGAGCGTPAREPSNEDIAAVASRPSKPIPASMPPFRLKQRMTYEALKKERQNYWTSRFSGNDAVWNALEQVSAMLLNSNDVDTCNAILQASMLSTPNGDLTQVYDETGVCYEIPRYCFQNPTNLVDGLESAPAVSDAKFKSETIEIKFRIGAGLEQDDTKCSVDTTNTVEDITNKFRENSEKAANASRIRLFFYGREMNPKDICAACNLRKDGLVVLAVLYE